MDDDAPLPGRDEACWSAMQLDAVGRPLQQVWRERVPLPAPGQPPFKGLYFFINIL